MDSDCCTCYDCDPRPNSGFPDSVMYFMCNTCDKPIRSERVIDVLLSRINSLELKIGRSDGSL